MIPAGGGGALGAEPLRGQRVLIVEDDPLIAMSLGDLLSEGGAEPLPPVPTVAAALAALESGSPDAAVLDLNLRGEWSTPVARALRATGVPFVLATGYARSQIEDPALRDAPLVPKPIDPRLLLSRLAQAIAER